MALGCRVAPGPKRGSAGRAGALLLAAFERPDSFR
jgi:hypothetical protein